MTNGKHRSSTQRKRFVSRAVRDVIDERKRQREQEHWSHAHDDTHVDGELADAAVAYALPPHQRSDARLAGQRAGDPPWVWPFERSGFKPKGRREDLVRAAALLLAEIERLDRQGDRAAARAMRRVNANAQTSPEKTAA